MRVILQAVSLACVLWLAFLNARPIPEAGLASIRPELTAYIMISLTRWLRRLTVSNAPRPDTGSSALITVFALIRLTGEITQGWEQIFFDRAPDVFGIVGRDFRFFNLHPSFSDLCKGVRVDRRFSFSELSLMVLRIDIFSEERFGVLSQLARIGKRD